MDPQELGRQVSKRRKELGISQESLAANAAVSRNYISLIERGEARNVSVNILNSIATALGATPNQLIGQSEQDEILAPPALRELAQKEGLTFETVYKLANIPRRGQEPKTIKEWRELYEVVRRYLND